jgi:hypothetical protein
MICAETTAARPEAIDRFEAILAEITGRIHNYAQRFPKAERDEAEAEMLALSFSRFVSKAKRTGIYLTPGQAAFMAYLGVRDGRVLATGGGVTDVQSKGAFRAGNIRGLFSLSQPSTNESDRRAVKSITNALTASEYERPDHRAAVRLDWTALALRLDRRQQQILQGLATGERKTDLAEKLHVSPGRLSQLLSTLADEIRGFFGEENLPACCAS